MLATDRTIQRNQIEITNATLPVTSDLETYRWLSPTAYNSLLHDSFTT